MDFDVPGRWLTRAHLERLGVPAAAITASGIPIDPVFAVPKDARAMRVKHSLAPDRTTMLVSRCPILESGWQDRRALP